MRRVTVFSARNPESQLIFCEKLFGESSWLVEKKDLFDCKFIFIFQPDGCAKSTCAVTCFIHFGQSHRPENIQKMLSFFFFQLKRVLVVFLYVCLSIHFAGEFVRETYWSGLGRILSTFSCSHGYSSFLSRLEVWFYLFSFCSLFILTRQKC